MQFSFSLANTIDPIAVYAAILSTLVFLWQLFQWWNRGPKLKITVTANMKMIGGIQRDDNTYVTINVNNIGTEKTTIKGIYISGYKNILDQLKNKASFSAIVKHSVVAYPIPYVLEVGETFMSMFLQDEKLESQSRALRLYIGVSHSFADKMQLIRIKSIDQVEK